MIRIFLYGMIVLFPTLLVVHWGEGIRRAQTPAATSVVPHRVELQWKPSTTPGVIGYKVYRAESSGGPYTVISGVPASETRFTDTSVKAGRTYFYEVTAVAGKSVGKSQSQSQSHSHSDESIVSNQVEAHVPVP